MLILKTSLLYVIVFLQVGSSERELSLVAIWSNFEISQCFEIEVKYLEL